MNKRAKIKSKKITDVLLSSDITEAQGFLQENGDDLALVVFRDEEDEEEMEGTEIPWSVIGDTYLLSTKLFMICAINVYIIYIDIQIGKTPRKTPSVA
jgi:hypothetical protein